MDQDAPIIQGALRSERRSVSLNEIIAIVAGLGFGYLVVSMLLDRKPAQPPQPPPNCADHPSESAEVPAPPTPARWHEVLGVSPQSSVEEIRAAYRRCSSQYHPDKVAALGQELQDLAERKFKEITRAYQEGVAEREGKP